MRKIIFASAVALLLSANAASANPIIAIVQLAVSAISGYVATAYVAIGFTAANAAFLAAATIKLAAGLVINSALSRGGQSRSNSARISDLQINSRIEDGQRWQLAGRVAAGGIAGAFAERDEIGAFWYIIIHGDGEAEGNPTYFLDGIEVELDSGNNVVTNEFSITSKDFDVYEGSGTQKKMYMIWNVGPSSGSPYGTRPVGFTERFPSLPDDFHLTGVNYSIIRIAPTSRENTSHQNTYRWRGPIGLGEPSVIMVDNFARMYDPRNPAHDIDDESTWTFSDGNSAIIWAWWRTNPRGRNKPMSSVDWDELITEANICDEQVADKNNILHDRYRCGIAIPDGKPKLEAEQEILITCDGYVAQTDNEKSVIRVGSYEAADMTFTKARDIIAAQTLIIDDGETNLDGVIVNYIEPSLGFTKHQSAPWKNPAFYDPTRLPEYVTVDALGCQDHNQAVRIAKALGQRLGATKKASFISSIKGFLVEDKRSVNVEWDSDFDGEFEIIVAPEETDDGNYVNFSVVPMDPDRWTLLDGEEGNRPSDTPDLNINLVMQEPQNVLLVSANIEADTQGSFVARIEATFDEYDREDRAIQIRFAEDGTDDYQYMLVDMEIRRAYSPIVRDGVTYNANFRTINFSGRATDWTADVPITITSNSTPPVGPLTTFTSTGQAGSYEVELATDADVNQRAVTIKEGTTAVFEDSVDRTTVFLAQNSTATVTVSTGIGTYYIWAIPKNGSGVAGPAEGPQTVNVT